MIRAVYETLKTLRAARGKRNRLRVCPSWAPGTMLGASALGTVIILTLTPWLCNRNYPWVSCCQFTTMILFLLHCLLYCSDNSVITTINCSLIEYLLYGRSLGYATSFNGTSSLRGRCFILLFYKQGNQDQER